MQPTSLEALPPISAEQNFKNLCSSFHDTTSKRFMYCLEHIKPNQAVEVAIQVVHSPHSAKRDVELNAVIKRFPNEDYGNVCANLLQVNRLQNVIHILKSTPNTRLTGYANELLFLQSVKEKNPEGIWISLRDHKKISFSTISTIVDVNNDDLIHNVREKYQSTKFNLDLLEAICDNHEVDFIDHMRWCLKNIPLNRNTSARLNDCLERSVGFEIVKRIKMLLPHYLPMYQEGVVLAAASATENLSIFNMIAELTPKPEKILQASLNDWDDDALVLLKGCVEERANVKQKEKILKRVAKRIPDPATTLRRKM